VKHTAYPMHCTHYSSYN